MSADVSWGHALIPVNSKHDVAQHPVQFVHIKNEADLVAKDYVVHANLAVCEQTAFASLRKENEALNFVCQAVDSVARLSDSLIDFVAKGQNLLRCRRAKKRPIFVKRMTKHKHAADHVKSTKHTIGTGTDSPNFVNTHHFRRLRDENSCFRSIHWLME